MTPTTEAGRALLELLVKANVTVGNATAHVERIEAEAAAAERERIRAASEEVEDWNSDQTASYVMTKDLWAILAEPTE